MVAMTVLLRAGSIAEATKRGMADMRIALLGVLPTPEA